MSAEINRGQTIVRRQRSNSCGVANGQRIANGKICIGVLGRGRGKGDVQFFRRGRATPRSRAVWGNSSATPNLCIGLPGLIKIAIFEAAGTISRSASTFCWRTVPAQRSQDPLCCRPDATGFGRGRPTGSPTPQIQAECWLPISGPWLIVGCRRRADRGRERPARRLKLASDPGSGQCVLPRRHQLTYGEKATSRKDRKATSRVKPSPCADLCRAGERPGSGG